MRNNQYKINLMKILKKMRPLKKKFPIKESLSMISIIKC